MIALCSIGVPRISIIFPKFTNMLLLLFLSYTSCFPFTITPPAVKFIRYMALSAAKSTLSRSMPFSNLKEASDRIPILLAVCRMDNGLKNALSRAISLVFSVISEFSPPIIPAMATGPDPSHIRISPLRIFLSSPSRVLNTIFSFATLTSIRFSRKE